MNKGEMYHNKIEKTFHNNRTIYTSFNKEHKIVKEDIRKKIQNILNSNTFIYSKKVNIVIGNDTITRKIIGVYKDNLVTIDNEYIPIDNIRDIYF